MHNRKISVIGLGYVGLPLAIELGHHGPVIGYDVITRRIQELNNNIDSISLITSSELKDTNIKFTSNSDDLKQADFHIIAVPTPINEAKQPDLSPLISATETVASQLKKNDIVVYESTVYPGLTEEECIPLLEKISGLTNGSDFFTGYSPERINPGDKAHALANNVKVISAQDDNTLEIMEQVYSSVITAGIHKASSIKVAEAAKVIENTQRDINIALMNELSLIFNKMDIDTADVLDAAGTKWNFMKFTPGLVGGHCIGVDPYYLTYKALQLNYSPRIILAGRSVNDSMGHYIARIVTKELIKSDQKVKNSNVLILGFSFKENIPDIRNTKIIDIVNELKSFDINVQVCDPVVNIDDVKNEYNIDITLLEDIKPANAVILAVPHNQFINGSWELLKGLLINGKGIVYDVKSCLSREQKPSDIILRRL